MPQIPYLNTNQSIPNFNNQCKSLQFYLGKITDIRNPKQITYSLVDVLIQTILAYLSNNLSVRENQDFGLNHFELAPSKSTIDRVLTSIDPKELNNALTGWFKSRFSLEKDIPHIAIDGKILKNYTKSDFSSANCKSIAHISSFICNLKYTIKTILSERKPGKIRYPKDRNKCQEIYQNKQPSETEAFRLMTEELSQDISKFLVTGDSIHLNINTLALLKDKHLDFIFGIKQNAPKLLEFLKQKSILVSNFKIQEKQIRKQIEISAIPKCTITNATSKNKIWNNLNLQAFIKITTTDSKRRKVTLAQRIKTRTQKIRKGKYTQVKSKEDVKITINYYVSSLNPNLNPTSFLQLIKEHWQIENYNHRERDVTFQEDTRLMQKPNKVKNTATLLTNTLNLFYTNTNLTIKKAVKKYTNRLDLCLDLIKDRC